jgi:NAD+ kinase
MNSFAVIRNTDKALAASCADQIFQYLHSHNCECVISDTGADLPEDTECGIVLGGDGTLLRAAKVVLDRQLPLIGVNLGTLGYMAEVDVKNLYPALDRLIDDVFTIEKRMMLHGSVYHDSEKITEDVALNDIVILGRKQMRAYTFKCYVNDAYLTTYHSDGMILATPTGSTGYSLSEGGPVVSPGAEIEILTPIASHSLISRSIIFPGTDRINIEIGEGRMGPQDDVAYVNFDGENDISLATGDVVEIQKSEQFTRFIKINNISFLEVLRRKMADQ